MEQSWARRDRQLENLTQEPSHAVCGEKMRFWEKRFRYPITFKDGLTLLKAGFSEQMIKTAPYDLELQILFLACFHPISMENNDTAWISIFINGFLFKINTLLEVFPLHFRQTDNFLNPSGMCKPGCKALLKCMRKTIFIYTIFMATKKH